MRITTSFACLAFLLTLSPIAYAVTPAADCSFREVFVSRSGQLPFSGTLDEQVAASMENVFSISNWSQISYGFSIGKHPAVRITAKDGTRTIREYYYVNKGTASYQFNLSATPATYAKQKKNLRILMRDPFGEQKFLCK